ncbi:MAG: DUF4142 domain-containing protein [Hyalangium sp.]|uniref:DUF4142 domain-containing protein n=1 Tax=Hyalangium sp. TaxID=2028555 RepID=UPI00389A13B4
MKMRRYLLGTGLMMMIGLGGACSHESKYEAARKTGQQVGEAVATKVQFADQFAMLDKKEVALGKLALKKSSNSQVRAFAHQLIENHEQHLASLDSYADASALRLAQIDLSTEPGVGGSGGPGSIGVKEAAKKQSAQYDEKLDKQIENFKGQLRDLSAKSGSEFDKDFLAQIEKDQKTGTELTEKGLKEYSDDASLALLLGRNAPIFERQLEQAKALSASI